MPTYDYQCDACGHCFEQVHSMTQTPEVHCPKCGARSHRLISTGLGILLKGDSGSEARADCSWESTCRTCCGREERCSEPSCGDRA